MKSAILNNALTDIIDNTNMGYWLSVTHFSLAWASEEERISNPISDEMTDLISAPVNGFAKGDYIYNIWQQSTYANSSIYYSDYFTYEYDQVAKRNVLKANDKHPEVASGNWPAELTSNGFAYGFSLPGYKDASNLSQMTEAKIPYYLDYSKEANATDRGIGTFTKFFEIADYRKIQDNSSDGSTIVTQYTLRLSRISSTIQDTIQKYRDSIGNFKFNRVGLYMTVNRLESPVDGSDEYIKQYNKEPILFAVIDLSVDGCTGNDVGFDVYKTRGDEGFSGWEFKAQLGLNNKSINYANVGANIVQATTTFYEEAEESDATRKYKLEIMNSTAMAETIMQLQMMVLQLSTEVEKITGVNPYNLQKSTGYDVEGALEENKEYQINKNNNNRMLLDGLAYRGINTDSVTYINDSSALFSLSTVANDGDVFKVTIYNLDGTYFNNKGYDAGWWSGSIVFANNNAGTKTKIYELTSDTIKGITYAKATITLSFSASLSKWILETVSIIDESSSILTA